MPTTWKPWFSVNNVVYVANSGSGATSSAITSTTTTTLQRVQILDSYFPIAYTPANAYWLRSFINNAIIPWNNAGDLFSNFWLAGGTSSTLVGAAAGLNYIAGQQYFNSKIWGLGYPTGTTTAITGTTWGGPGIQELNAPQMGYCIGDRIKQQVYVQFDVINTVIHVEQLQLPRIELLQNSKFKRIYVCHGEVANYREVTNASSNTTSHILTLDVTRSTKSPGVTAPADSIKISNSNGGSMTLTVAAINNDWSLVVSAPPAGNIPKPGDFYEIQGNKVWCIEDPLLLSGFWLGNETDATIIPGESLPPSSGKNLYVTSHNAPYAEGSYAGYYVYQALPTTTTTTTGGGTATPTTTTGSTTTLIPSPGATMMDSGGYEWAWHRSVTEDRYKDDLSVYANAVALADSVTADPDEPIWSRRYYPRTITTSTTPPAQTFVRVDIGLANGGSRYRHNWFAPCLDRSYIKNSDGYFKILAHVESSVIDVNKKDVTGTKDFDIGKDFEIVNQYGWMINEHYQMSNITGTACEGIFAGDCTSITYSSLSKTSDVTLAVKGDTLPTYYVSLLFNDAADFGDNSFKNRYQKTLTTATGEPTVLYSKYQDWKLVFDRAQFITPPTATSPAVVSIKDQEFSIKGAVTFPALPPSPFLSNGYSISFTVEGDASAFVSKPAYISFDTPFPLLDPQYRSKQNGSNFDLKIEYFATGPIIGTSTDGVLHLRGEYISNPYAVDIPSNTLIGFCEGRYFGIATARYPNLYSLYFRVTTPFLPVGIASLFHALRAEDWVIYMDSVTKKITARRGSLHFREYPMKSEIVVSEPSAPMLVSGGTLSTSYDRLRRIRLKVPNSAVYLMFGLGTADNIFGFYVSGDGIVDLQALRLSGSPAGTVAPSTYKGEGQIVSPVYQYQYKGYQNVQSPLVDIGADTAKYGTIHFINGTPSDVYAQYTNNNYVLGDGGIETTLFDVHRAAYGEIIMVYGQTVDQFTCDGNLNNSRDNNTQWRTPRGVMLLSTNNDSFVWGTPLKRVYNQRDYQYPLLVLNDVDFLASIYNPLSYMMSIFVLCTDETSRKNFVGCFTLSTMQLLHKTFVCTFPSGAAPMTAFSTAGILYGSSATTASTTTASPSTTTASTTTVPASALPVTTVAAGATRPPIDFMWRPPAIPDAFITDISNSWTPTPITDSYSYTASMETPRPSDLFVRILGPSGTNSQFAYDGSITYTSAHIMEWGLYVFFYGTNQGIRALYSQDGGQHWGGTDVVYVRGANCPLLIGRYMFYITPSGIGIKNFTMGDYGRDAATAMKKLAGTDTATEEISIQSNFDTLVSNSLLGTGEVSLQRLSGYVTDDGVIKLFYYNSEKLLTCMESSSGGLNWKVSNNF